MNYHSRVVSGQPEAIHPNLETTVSKHLINPFQRPVQPYNVAAINAFYDYWESSGHPDIILDAGCGTGASTRILSERFPEHLVAGIDQSLHRLSKNGAGTGLLMQGNLCLLRADLVDCWRLIIEKQLPVARHFILYPNPWPKKKHLQRRWHGHPVFADLIRVSPNIELRSNWKTYVDEFAVALGIAADEHTRISGTGVSGTGVSGTGVSGTKSFGPDHQNYLTPFEKKYALSGQTLYRLTVNMNSL